MTEINRAVCVDILEQARVHIQNESTNYVCVAIRKTGFYESAEREFLLNFIVKELDWDATLARWIMRKDIAGFHEDDDGPGMKETRLAWIDDMIRRFKL